MLADVFSEERVSCVVVHRERYHPTVAQFQSVMGFARIWPVGIPLTICCTQLAANEVTDVDSKMEYSGNNTMIELRSANRQKSAQRYSYAKLHEREMVPLPLDNYIGYPIFLAVS